MFLLSSFAVSTVLVNLSRPLYIVGQKCMFVKLKVAAQGIAELCKCVLTVILVLAFPHWGLINFAVAQERCVWFSHKHGFTSYFVYYINRKAFIDSTQGWLTMSIFKQSFMKQLLTEGEKVVMTIFGVPRLCRSRGRYDIVNNLGSMAARFVFQPYGGKRIPVLLPALVHEKPVTKQKQDSCTMTVEVFAIFLKIAILLGGVILVFDMALDMYGGSILSTGAGPVLLRWYSLYVLITAVNGMTQCCVFATMSKAQVDKKVTYLRQYSVISLKPSCLLLLGNLRGYIGVTLSVG